MKSILSIRATGPRGWCLATAASVTLGTSAPLVAQSQSWTRAMAPVRIADSLYYVGTEGLSSFLLVSREGHILIDPTLDQNVPDILRRVEGLGFDPHDIEILLTTHAHWDHVGGAARLMAETGAELWVSRGDAPYVREGTNFGFDSDRYPPAEVAREIEDGDVVSLGGVELTALITPGHTPGCTSWTGTVHLRGVPYRFLLVCSLSPLDLYRLSGDEPTHPGQADDFCSSVLRLRSIEADIFLSNHAVFFDLGRKAAEVLAGRDGAFVAPQDLARFLEEAEARISRERERQGLPPCRGE